MASDPDDPTQPSGQLYYSIQQSNADAKIFAIGNIQMTASKQILFFLFIFACTLLARWLCDKRANVARST